MIDTTNKFLVGARADKVVIMRPVREMTKEEALVLAAYLVSVADPTDSKFPEYLEAVQNT